MGEIAGGTSGRVGGAGRAGERRRAWGKTLAALAAPFASGSALVIVALARLGPGPPVVMASGYVAAVTLPLCVVDLRERRLPNTLVGPGFAFGAAALAWQGLARGSPPWAALGLCVGTMLVFGVLASLGGVGIGDVKLAGMLALTLAASGLGVEAVGLAVGSAFVTAGAVAVGVLVLQKGAAPNREIPFGPFLLAGFWVSVWAG
jgi:leader peptidase (prepilin peptidase)/N-methyltransferase